MTEDHLTTEETPYQDKKTADVHRNQFSSWAKVKEDTLDEAAPHRTYSVKPWTRLYGWHMRTISGAAYTVDEAAPHIVHTLLNPGQGYYGWHMRMISGAAYTDQTHAYTKSQ